MSGHHNPPKPLLPYDRQITFNPQISTISDTSEKTDASMPFYYASFVGIWVYWFTDIENVKTHFDRGDFRPYIFKDNDGAEKALTVINFQTYTSHAGMALGTVNEVEFNICAYPASDSDRIPMGLSLEDFLMGIDQTKRIGLFRIHVPADNTIAVAAGRAFFGEPKFFAQFQYMIPALNLPSQKSWDMSVYDKDAIGVNSGTLPDPKHLIFHLTVPEIVASPQWANVSPLALYTYVDGIPNGSHWQMLLPMESYCPIDESLSSGIKMEAGGSPEMGMAADIKKLIGNNPAVGIQVFRSNPSCIEGGAYDVR